MRENFAYSWPICWLLTICALIYHLHWSCRIWLNYFRCGISILGDQKYIRPHLKMDNILPTKISSNAMSLLELRKNDLRKLPLFIHLAEVRLPEGPNTIVIKSQIPPFMAHAIKKLKLLHKWSSNLVLLLFFLLVLS